MYKQEPKVTDWKWRYSVWTGIMYGPIPVGIIIAVIVTLCLIVYELAD